jgi:hypothetical protein
MPHLNHLITPSTEMGHRQPMTINAFASSFHLLFFLESNEVDVITKFSLLHSLFLLYSLRGTDAMMDVTDRQKLDVKSTTYVVHKDEEN